LALVTFNTLQLIQNIMLILGIETSTPKMSVALTTETHFICEVVVDSKGRQPLLLAIEQVFVLAERKREELTGIAYSRGPGAFTGLRVGLATAKGIAYALQKPLVGVPTLEAFAKRFSRCLVAPLLDAKKGEVYGALFHNSIALLSERACKPEDMALLLQEASQQKPVLCVGDGAALLQDKIPGALYAPELSPSAREIAVLGAAALAMGQQDDLTASTPTYLRLPEAVVNQAKKQP
jgi:tRNA threonylcarbamoyladenosine biosynthesis protein TsaB